MKIEHPDEDTLILSAGWGWMSLVTSLVLFLLGCSAIVIGADWILMGVILIPVSLYFVFGGFFRTRWIFSKTTSELRTYHIKLLRPTQASYSFASIREVDAGCYTEAEFMNTLSERIKNPAIPPVTPKLTYTDDDNVICHIQLILRTGETILFRTEGISPSDAGNAKMLIENFLSINNLAT